MTQKVPPPPPQRPNLSPEARARRRAQARRRRTVLVGTLFAAVVISGVLAWQRLSRTEDASSGRGGLFQGTSRAQGSEAALNGGVLSNAVQVQAALEQVRKERGALPESPEAFDQWVLPRLPGGQLPRSPWGGQQPGILGMTPELKRAVAANGAERWVVGTGRDAETIERPTDFGALIYDPSGQSYRIYGIGQGADGRAVVLVRLTSP